MARILISTYMVRYPLGGMLSWALQYALGFHRLGHDVYLLERANYPDACFNPRTGVSSDDGRANYQTVSDLLRRFELEQPLVFEAYDGELFGCNPANLETIFRRGDLLVDIGNHGAWLEEAGRVGIPTVRIDGEPGYTQMKMEQDAAEGQSNPEYEYYYTNGANIGTRHAIAPDAGKLWRHVFNPVDTELFSVIPPPVDGQFTTVMNWQSHAAIDFGGRSYGQKDVEFEYFMKLPERVSVPMEVAAAGNVPEQALLSSGWRIRDAHKVTESLDSYCEYIAGSLGEFSVCKNVFIATRSGWFSDRSAAYLACGRPVVLQDTGFSAHLPCGEGLFAVSNVDEASSAIEQILTDYSSHARAARELAVTYLDAQILMGKIVTDVGI